MNPAAPLPAPQPPDAGDRAIQRLWLLAGLCGLALYSLALVALVWLVPVPVADTAAPMATSESYGANSLPLLPPR